YLAVGGCPPCCPYCAVGGVPCWSWLPSTEVAPWSSPGPSLEEATWVAWSSPRAPAAAAPAAAPAAPPSNAAPPGPIPRVPCCAPVACGSCAEVARALLTLATCSCTPAITAGGNQVVPMCTSPR